MLLAYWGVDRDGKRTPAQCTADEAVIMCTSQRHCQGCDQCEDSTVSRRATLRVGGAVEVVRICDGCAETITAGESDYYTSVVEVLT